MASTPVEIKRYPDAAALADRLAADIAANLSQAIAQRGLASLVLSGGNSPVKLFQALSARPLDWSRVCVALADERWVDPAAAGSNEKLVRDNLLRGPAAAARFTGLKNAAPSPDLGAAAAWETFAGVPRPFDVLVLGMGDDGHTASLFPHSPNLPNALDPSAAAGCVAMRAPTVPHARLSLNLSALLGSRRIYILLLGDAKLRTFTTANGAGPVADMPVRAVLRQDHTPVEVVWAP
jgi:6-phosphogluconolactonase